MKYIDTSAFVKYYSAEPAEKGAEQIKKLMDNAKKGEEALLSSVLLIGEAVSVFDKWLRLKRITNEGLDKAIGKFILDVRELTEGGNLTLEPVNVFNSLFSVDYIVKYHLTVNDALHLYAALVHGRTFHSRPTRPAKPRDPCYGRKCTGFSCVTVRSSYNTTTREVMLRQHFT